jgi:hypothetical protein
MSAHARQIFIPRRVRFQRDGNGEGLASNFQALSLVTLASSHLTQPRIGLSLPFRHQDRQECLGHPFASDIRRHHRSYYGPGFERGFPEQTARVYRARGHRVGCRPGACVCGPGRPIGETLDPPPLAARAAPFG